MKRKPYPKYKDSGVEWLGAVPAHWPVTRLRRIADGGLINGLFKTKDSYGRGVPMVNVFDVYQSDFQIRPESLDRVQVTSEEMEKYKVAAGDLVFVRSSLKLEGIGVCALVSEVPEPTVFECHLVRLHPRRNLVLPRFLALYLGSMSVRHRLVAAAQTTTMTTIAQEGIACLEVLQPPQQEQVQIVDHLDRETAKIDTLIAKQQRLIELLQEKRQALISHAVTKGPQPDAPMKPSGVEWLGDVPAHWDVMSLKRQTRRIDVGIAEAATHAYVLEAEKDSVPILRSTNVRANAISGELFFISGNFAASRSSKRLRANDIVTVRTGNAGVSAVVPAHLDSCHCFTMLITTLAGTLDPTFCAYFLNSSPAQAYFSVEGWGAAQANISVPILGDTQIPVPPLAEQFEIVGHIASVSTSLQELTDKANAAIALMQEHRTALISAAVTGKIDVREPNHA